MGLSFSHPVFEIVTTTAGAISIRNKVVNEIMHNPVGPWAEANALYIEQSGLKAHLSQSSADEFVIFDVGLGAAANALAALACARSLPGQARSLRIVSFEKDLDLLRFALEHASSFEHFRGYESAIETLLKEGSWSDGKVSWQVHAGDFLETVSGVTHRPHLIFFDPYSPQVNQEMWTIQSFQKLRKHSRSPSDGGTVLYTYSRSTRIRAAMICAGFYVGCGSATGLKDETTEAATDWTLLKAPLGIQWRERFKKSHVRLPYGSLPEDQGKIDGMVMQYLEDLR